MSNPTSSAFVTAVAAEFANAIEGIAGSPVTQTAAVPRLDRGWTIPMTLSGALRGTVRLVLDEAGVVALLQLMLGGDADTSEASARDLLGELANQAVSAACMQAAFAKVSATVGAVALAPLHGDESPVCTLSRGQMSLAIVAATADAAAGLEPGTAAGRSVAALPAAGGRKAATAVATPANLDVVLDIELPLSVRFGSTMMSIRSLSAIGPGSIVDMGRSPDDPVEILVCGRPIARAEVVIVGGNYGVRITDLTSAAERLRAMEGQL